MPVYMARNLDKELVKIGWSIDVPSRIRTLEQTMGIRLIVLRIIEGPKRLEKAFHREFSVYHVTGEWFNFNPAMLTCDLPDQKGGEYPLYTLIADAGYFQNWVARQIGIDKATFSRIVHGRSALDARKIEALASVLRVPISRVLAALKEGAG